MSQCSIFFIPTQYPPPFNHLLQPTPLLRQPHFWHHQTPFTTTLLSQGGGFCWCVAAMLRGRGTRVPSRTLTVAALLLR
ncbi:hypothetical protein HanRHA438_Chr10g0468731 [Helianthus annuus]|nr:hypothetical protein HanIR_Chr10g0491351 [Helianthus annuus]KAJ0880931.1 hypothetical protein HanRHA438_Chr10g0468731 [Helianthus annuus]